MHVLRGIAIVSRPSARLSVNISKNTKLLRTRCIFQAQNAPKLVFFCRGSALDPAGDLNTTFLRSPSSIPLYLDACCVSISVSLAPQLTVQPLLFLQIKHSVCEDDYFAHLVDEYHRFYCVVTYLAVFVLSG